MVTEEQAIIPMSPSNMDGALAAALANAQAAFPVITRAKTVTVTTKTGGSYTFKYAPLDSILEAVRKPLSDNGLAIAQLLDDGELVTMLMHKDGGRLSGRVALPNVEGVQALGSAITYLRRYSIQAILGIAAEEDDDGNRAQGNDASFMSRPRGPQGGSGAPVRPQNHPSAPAAAKAAGVSEDGGLIGIAIAQGTADFELRQAPDGYTLPFRVTEGGKSFIVLAKNQLAEALALVKDSVLNQRVTVWGHWGDVVIPGRTTYQALYLDRIATADFILPAPATDTPMPEFPDDLGLDGPRDDVSLLGEVPAA